MKEKNRVSVFLAMAWGALVMLPACGMLHPQPAPQKPPQAGANAKERVYQVPGMPMDLKPATVGQGEKRVVTLKLQGIRSAALVITAFDIDAPEEAGLFVNRHPVRLPEAIVADMLDRTITLPIPVDLLRDGPNEFRFEFANDLGGSTNGFVIRDLKVILRK